MKKFYLFAATALALASCSSDEYVGDNFQGTQGNGEISFAMNVPNATRAGELTGQPAADKLKNQFVVYGWKSNGWTDGANTGDAGSYNSPQDVFQNYLVTYNGNAGQTESNTHGWEYVGNTSMPIGATGVEQSIKYWDYSYSQYDFIAWSITEPGATLNEIGTSSVNPYKIHSLSFSAPAASDLAKIYVSNQETVLRDNLIMGQPNAGDYKKVVTLTFRNMASKVRVGLYETVPGYSVKDVKFYTVQTSDVVADGGLSNEVSFYDKAGNAVFATSGSVKVEYRDVQSAGILNEAVVTSTAAESASSVSFKELSNYKDKENLEATGSYLGRASNEATLSTGDDATWTYEFPKEASELVLKCDYTLVSTDGSGETIKVTGAKATVPANYGEWKANYAYTYLFKISDNTNGATTGVDPDVDPDTPAGLYPITFDAVVVDVQTGNTQETITELAETPITTYQKGSTSTAESEYKAYADGGFIYVNNNAEVMNISETGANTKLYVAVDMNNDNEGITEKTVANYANNDIVLIDVSASTTTEGPANVTKIVAAETYDNIEKTLDKAGFRFMPQAGQTYVVEFTNAAGHKVYKVIKVTGTPSNTFALSVDNATVAEGSSVTVTAKVGDNLVYGAKNVFSGATAFDITDNNDGTYTFTAKAGTATGAKSVTLGGSDALAITVNAYEFSAANVDVNEGATSTITLKLGTGAAEDVDADTDFTITGTGLSITGVADGVVTIKAAAGAQSGKITYKNGTTEVASATVTVKSYALTAAPAIINKGEKSTLTLTLGGTPCTTATTLIKASADGGDIDETTITTSATNGTVQVTGASKGNITFRSDDFSSQAYVEVIDAKVEFVDAAGVVKDAAQLTASTTYTMTFKDGGTETNAALVGENCTISKKSGTGVYEITTAASGTVKVKYTYKGVTFTLAEKAL